MLQIYRYTVCLSINWRYV